VTQIRPFEADDVEAVAALYSHIMLKRSGHPAPDVVAFLHHTLVDGPWQDRELPSLVSVDDNGRIVGFIGSNPRRLRLRDEDLRAVWAAHLMVDPERSDGPAGALLLRRLLRGPQDLTLTDTASRAVTRMWEAFGGRVDPLRSLQWMHVLRPARWLAAVASRRLKGEPASSLLTPVAAVPFHIVGSQLAGREVRMFETQVTREPLAPAALAQHAADMLPSTALRPWYDAGYAERLVARVEGLHTYGDFRLRLARRGDVAIGWYASYVRPGGPCRVLAVGARSRDADAVVGDLFEDAREVGATLVTGRLEPLTAAPVLRRHSVVGGASRCLVHSRDPTLVSAVLDGGATISRMDGEWW
jgi:hypothetical protein